MTRYRPTVVEIDLDAIAHNVRLLRPPGAELMAVVKADGYGHGDAEVARAALEAGASRLGVSLVEEGLGLRDRGIDAPILVLAEFPPGSEKEALERGLTPTVYTDEGVAGVAEAARALGRPAGVHLKLDTGMHRVGLWPPEQAPAFARRVLEAGLELEGLWTHFADSELDEAGTLEQLTRFRAAADALAAVGITPGVLHAANSGATIRFPQTHLDLVRPGAAVYGIDPGGGLAEPFGLRPALSWRSAVTMVKRLPAGERLSYGGRYALERDATIATVPVGYDDGFPRRLGGKGEVLIGGRRRPVVGHDHDGPDPRGLRGRPGVAGRRGRADRRPGRRTHHGRGARRARRDDRAPDRDRDRRTRPAGVPRGGRTIPMSRKRTALVTAGIAAGAVAGGVIGRTVLNARRRVDPEADEHLSELPPEDLGPVRSFDGTELAVRAAGDPSDPTIVFVHGFSLDMTTWHYQWTGLSDRYRCVLFDFRSHGRSARAAGGDLSPLAFGHDLAAVLARGRGPAGAPGRAQHGRDVDAGDGRDPTRAVRGPGRGRGVRGLGRERSRPGRVRLGDRAPAASARFAAAGGRAREQAPAVRAVEPRRRRAADRSGDAVRTRRLAPPRPLRGRARRARSVRGVDRRARGADGAGPPPRGAAHRACRRWSWWASRIG